MELTRLFSPIAIGGMELKNRIIMPSLHHLYTPEGFATERFNEYYWRRAEGGAGLIITGGCRFDECGGAAAMMSLAGDEFVPGFQAFTNGMHERGAKVGVQLYHAGRYARLADNPRARQALAPSAVPSKFTRETPREMSKSEIRDVIRRWAQAAARAQAAGFDLVELVASAGYLVSQFLSPLTNLRRDEYGGSFENRSRFARELVAAVRAAVGPAYPVCMRVGGHDFVEGSSTNADAVAFCVMMEQAGVDMLDVTGGWHETMVPQLTGDVARGGYAYLAASIKDAVSVPVAASNRINDPVVAERILALGQADMVCAGRTLIADPDWPKKAQSGDFSTIRRCVACNQGCLAKTFFSKPVECLVNGLAGREYLYKNNPPCCKKNILVVGGGPAGCEFALRAAGQGHAVTLREAQSRLGGQLRQACAPPGKEEFKTLISFYEAALPRADVTLELGKTVTASAAGEGFDLIVTATGAAPVYPDFEWHKEMLVVPAGDILLGKVMAGRNVVIVGGGSAGCETARYLAREASLTPGQLYFLMEHKAETPAVIGSLLNSSRRSIAIVDIGKVGAGFEPGTGWPVLKDLERLSVARHPFTSVTGCTGSSVTLTTPNPAPGKSSQTSLRCDTVVIAAGAAPNNALYEELRALGVNCVNLGDSAGTGRALDAIRNAAGLAFSGSIFAGTGASL